MTRRRARALIGAVVLACIPVLLGSVALADDVRPVQIQIRELPTGAFDVQWSVPRVVTPQAMPSPRLPEDCRPEGERVFIDKPGVWLGRQAYRCPDGLAGRELGVRFPGYNIGLSTLVRLELLSGDQYAHMLNPGEETWRVPETDAGPLAELLTDARKAVVEGLRHFFTGWVHLAFLVVLGLFGSLAAGARLATAFFLGQLGGVLVAAVPGLAIPAVPAEIGVALATVLLAREALKPSDERRQLATLATCAGVAHGLGIRSLVSLPGTESAPEVLFSALFVLGMDGALLVSLAALSVLGRLVPGGRQVRSLARVAAYGAAGAAVALILGAFTAGRAADAAESERRLELPRLSSPSGGTAVPGSLRLATNMPDAAIQSFVSIEAFEVRHEVLVRLGEIAWRVGAASSPELAVEDQPAVKEAVRELVLARSSLEIDGQTPPPTSERVDFLTLDDKGVLPRPMPVPEALETAWVGVTTTYLTPDVTRSLVLGWDLLDGVSEIPTTVTDPESTRSETLDSAEPVLRWVNELAEDPVPRVSATAVEPAEAVVPVVSILLLVAVLGLGVAALLRRRSALSFALSRILLVLAILLAPVGNVLVALPASVGSMPSEAQTKRILARVLPNVYRAFEFREESAVFDRLALAVTGDTLTEIYLGHRKVLEMEERGGATARVEAVEILEVDAIEPGFHAGFVARTVWTVGGTVTHFGHRHFRQNRYDALVDLVPEEGIWKIRSIETLDQRRLR